MQIFEHNSAKNLHFYGNPIRQRSLINGAKRNTPTLRALAGTAIDGTCRHSRKRGIFSVHYRGNLGPSSVQSRYLDFFIGAYFTYTPPYIMQKRGKIYHLNCNFFAFLLHFLCNAVIIKVVTNWTIDFMTVFQ